MYTANDEQNHLVKYIEELILKPNKPKNNSFLKKVKEDVINSAMALLKGREMVFKALENGIFSKIKELEQSEQSSDDVKYNSYKLSKKLKDISLENISSDLNDTDNTGNKLFTPIKKEHDLKY